MCFLLLLFFSILSLCFASHLRAEFYVNLSPLLDIIINRRSHHDVQCSLHAFWQCEHTNFLLYVNNLIFSFFLFWMGKKSISCYFALFPRKYFLLNFEWLRQTNFNCDKNPYQDELYFLQLQMKRIVFEQKIATDFVLVSCIFTSWEYNCEQ